MGPHQCSCGSIARTDKRLWCACLPGLPGWRPRPPARSFTLVHQPNSHQLYYAPMPLPLHTLLLQVPAAVMLEAMGAYFAAVQDVEARHVGVRNCCYAADIQCMVDGRTWPPHLTECVQGCVRSGLLAVFVWRQHCWVHLVLSLCSSTGCMRCMSNTAPCFGRHGGALANCDDVLIRNSVGVPLLGLPATCHTTCVRTPLHLSLLLHQLTCCHVVWCL